MRDETARMIEVAIQRADHPEVLRAFQECGTALGRCTTDVDVWFVKVVTLQLRQNAVLYGVGERLTQAQIRLRMLARR